MKQAMDSDKHYLRSRRMLIAISLVLLITTMGGAQIYEINTFIFKLGFAHPENLFNILLWTAGFLLIRYYNNAAKYHKEIAEIWHRKLLDDNFINYYNEHASEFGGMAIDIAPSEVPFGESYDSGNGYENYQVDISLETRAFFNSAFVYEYSTEFEHRICSSPIYSCKNFRGYFESLWLIISYWWDAQFRNNDSLTLYGPYLIAFMAIGHAVIPRLFELYG